MLALNYIKSNFYLNISTYLNKKFKFIFHTNGHSRFKGILTDLAPHANSLLIKMLGIQNIRNCNIQISEHRVKCSFSYGETHVEYYLVEEQECKKRLEFIINDRKFRRLQKGYGDSYEVYLHDVFNDNIIEIQDPFRVFIERFVLSCKNETVCEFDEIKSNMQLMYDLLFQ